MMSDCCGDRNGATIGTRSACARCGSTGVTVDLLTVKALITEMALARLPAAPMYFCGTPTCPVVYFTADGQLYTKADVRVPVWQKEPVGSRIFCYCFDENERAMHRERRETGRCDAIRRVRDHIAAGRCACEVRNPRGACCLGDLIQAVAQLEMA